MCFSGADEWCDRNLLLYFKVSLVHVGPFMAPRRKQKTCDVCDMNDRIRAGKQTVCRMPGRAPAWAQRKWRNLGKRVWKYHTRFLSINLY
jgi:hypothetical protein